MSDLIRDPYDRQIADRADGPGPPEDADEVEEEEPVEEVVRAALERAHDRSELKLPDADLEVYEEEVVRALKGERPRDLVANVIFDDAFGLAPILADATHELERRLTRAFGDGGWTIDDHGEAGQVGGALKHPGRAS